MTDLSAYSYVPYSLQAGYCYAEDTRGSWHPGVRIENISYPLSVSRIQAALFSCLASGRHPRRLHFPGSAPGAEELLSFWQAEYELEAPGLSAQPPAALHNPLVSPGAGHRKQMYARLMQLCRNAVTPNSDFQVAALLEVENGAGFIPGVNIECSNWQLGLCAERIAIVRAISMGYNREAFGDLYVVAPKSDYVSPCGACRQVINEHLPGRRVYLYENEEKCMSISSGELLPYHFGGDILRKKPAATGKENR